MTFRLTREIVEAKCDTINTLNGIDPADRRAVGHIHLQGAYGGTSVRRTTEGGGDTEVGHNGYGPLRGCANILDGMIEQHRLTEELAKARGVWWSLAPRN